MLGSAAAQLDAIRLLQLLRDPRYTFSQIFGQWYGDTKMDAHNNHLSLDV